MSPSDTGAGSRLAAISAELREMTASPAMPNGAPLRELLTAATLLYGATVRQLGREVSLADPALTPTDVVVLCCALLRAQDLNPFDLTLWFGRIAPDSETGSQRP